MTHPLWRPLASADRDAILQHVGADTPAAAIELDLEFGAKAESAARRPTLYEPGRLNGTREIVVRPNYVMVYRVREDSVEVLRVLHTAQQWP